MAFNSDRNNTGAGDVSVLERRTTAGAGREYHREISRELSEIDRGMEDYSRALQSLVKRQSRTRKPNLIDRLRAMLERRQEKDSIDSLLSQWKDENLKVATEPVAKRASLPVSLKAEPVLPRQRPNSWKKPSAPRDLPPAREASRDDLRRLANLPVVGALLILAIGFAVNTFVPGNFLHGMFKNYSPIAGLDTSARDLLLAFASPVSDDKLAQTVEGIDDHKFQVLAFEEYVVQPNDNLSSIAQRFSTNMDTLISFNKLKNPRWLRNGQVLKVPNRKGLLHTVGKSDTLKGIADKYGVSTTAILDVNNMADETVVAGADIFVPDVRMNPSDLKLLLGDYFSWPTVGRMTSRYGFRSDPFTGRRVLHNGLDIANSIGTPVRAASAGKVVLAENQIGGYGKVIIVQHARGFKTLYGHLNSINVVVGQSVAEGQVIARMGNTGRSTGPHLHFSVNKGGVWVNPLLYLR